MEKNEKVATVVMYLSNQLLCSYGLVKALRVKILQLFN